MYTQCPSCSTIFSLTEEDLAAHEGLVRCGRCKAVFNASWNRVDGLPGEPRADIGSEQSNAALHIVDDAPDASDERGLDSTESDRIVAGQPSDTVELEFDLVAEPQLGGGAETEQDGDKSGDAVDPSPVPDFIEELSLQTGAEPVVNEPEPDFQPMAFETPDGPATDTPHYQSGTGVPPTPAENWIDQPTDGELRPSGVPRQQSPQADHLEPSPVEMIVPPPPADSAVVNTDTPSELAVISGEPEPSVESQSANPTYADVVDEEIVIEAPPTLWGFDAAADSATEATDQADESSADTTSVTPVLDPAKKGKRRLAGRRLDQVHLAAAKQGGAMPHQGATPELRRITASPTASDVKLVEIPYPRPVRAMVWVLASIVLALGLVWQIKSAYLSDLAQMPSLRGPLTLFCEYASCTLPPRADFKSIDLVSTNVDPHPVAPGALRVSANLVNRARFTQPFPPLEITLTDKEGVIVGRRTYISHEYRGDLSKTMLPNVLERVDIDLAQPAESAVGYEIQLVVR